MDIWAFFIVLKPRSFCHVRFKSGSDNRRNDVSNELSVLTWLSTFQFPKPDSDKDWEWQNEALEALAQTRLAWQLAINLVGRSMPLDLSSAGVLNEEIARTIDCLLDFRDVFPPRGENPELDTILDLAELALRRAGDQVRTHVPQ